jgi:hypothetical protein
MVEEIMEISGLPIDEISVDVSFTGTVENTLLAEAETLNWHTDSYGEAKWYTSERPTGGSVIIHVEEVVENRSNPDPFRSYDMKTVYFEG